MAVIEWGPAAAATWDGGMKLGVIPPYYTSITYIHTLSLHQARMPIQCGLASVDYNC